MKKRAEEIMHAIFLYNLMNLLKKFTYFLIPLCVFQTLFFYKLFISV